MQYNKAVRIVIHEASYWDIICYCLIKSFLRKFNNDLLHRKFADSNIDLVMKDLIIILFEHRHFMHLDEKLTSVCFSRLHNLDKRYTRTLGCVACCKVNVFRVANFLLLFTLTTNNNYNGNYITKFSTLWNNYMYLISLATILQT